MPIGSRSYYDSVGSADKKQNGSKPGLFGKGNQPAATTTKNPTQGRASVPVAKTGPAKKRRGDGAKATQHYVPPMSPTQAMAAPVAPVDGLVAQIVDLAGRVGSVLTQAESAVKRAEQLLASAADAASRSEAAALRAELAASRVQLSALGGVPQPSAELSVLDATIYNQSSQPAAETGSPLQDMLRSSMLQLDKISDRDTSENGGYDDSSNSENVTEGEVAPELVSGSGAPYGVKSDGPHADFAGSKGGQSAGTMQARDRVVGRASRHLERTERGNRDAVASGLVTFHHESEIPRVSPFILGLTPEASGQQASDDTTSSDQEPPRKIGLAV